VSVGSPLKQVPAERPAARLHWVRANIGWCLAVSGRPSKFAVTPVWRALLRLAVGSVAGIAVIAATMILVDAPAVTAAQRAPSWLIEIFDHVTEFGKSIWFLVPIVLALAMIALLATPALPRMSRGVLAALAVRLGFLFFAIGLPGLVFRLANAWSVALDRSWRGVRIRSSTARSAGMSNTQACRPAMPLMRSPPPWRSARYGHARVSSCGPMPFSSR
jgi:hypothetical protein